MKIQVISDLHTDVNGLPDPNHFACEADIMIVAGDVGPAPTVVPTLLHITQHIKDRVLYVPGNHEPYGLDTTWEETINFLSRECESSQKIICLRADVKSVPATYGYNGVRFNGDTLWTDFRLHDTLRDRRQQYFMACARDGMNDYRRIKDLTPEGTANRSGYAFSNLKGQLRLPGMLRNVGISHHLPTAQSLNSKYGRSPLNPSFASNYDSLLDDCVLWVHGHTHSSADYTHQPSGCRVICNPKGYADENPMFNPRLVVEI